MTDHTNNGCACTPNTSIRCAVTNCANHCKDAQYCGLNTIQVGTHEALLADTAGKYHELWHAQAQYYDEKAVKSN